MATPVAQPGGVTLGSLLLDAGEGIGRHVAQSEVQRLTVEIPTGQPRVVSRSGGHVRMAELHRNPPELHARCEQTAGIRIA
jgi:hypothetical protein